MEFYREISSLSENDSFLIFDRKMDFFDFPLHYHPEVELNLILGAGGAIRILGDSMEEIRNKELVLVGANVIHGWQQHNCAQEDIHEITIHFHEKLLSRELLSRNLLKPIRDMLQRAQYGILFSEETTQHIFTRLQKLAQTQGISQFLEMFSILHEMAVSEDQRLLTSTLKEIKDYYQHDPLLDLHQIIHMRYKEKLTLEEVAEKLKMSVPSFCRFIKKRTGKTFIQYVNEIRIAHASRQLIETDQTIAEIAFASGFNNLANFNRLFKKKKQMTPTTYRTQYVGFKRVL